LEFAAKRLRRGFAFVELMIVIAIVGILAATAIPSYNDYIARSQISQAVAVIASAKPLFAELYATKDR
jgi:type IV pilus assembly protein PilA